MANAHLHLYPQSRYEMLVYDCQFLAHHEVLRACEVIFDSESMSNLKWNTNFSICQPLQWLLDCLEIHI